MVKNDLPEVQWGKIAPVEIDLKAGKNVLKFHGPSRVTINHFTLTP